MGVKGGCKMISISIHALLTESDHPVPVVKCKRRRFQSTLSSRRATVILVQPGDQLVQISIHALLTESDSKYHQIGPIVSV